ARVLLTLMCVGAAEISIEETGHYIKERKAFGKPIGKFQGVQFPLVEAHSHVELIKLYCYRTLWLRDQGLSHTKEA
ncbi:MAG TPA: cyclohexanecarboxyl-CoA dehydrogenase, partial [Gammaproteobacteria bacterium]|nr:cyclohexanecarboxyl-CoA dehydrogenase [Gammaproteobacteria bacterium]